MTEQGVLEAIAALYPTEAWQLLYILGPRGAGGGLGYKLHFLDAAAAYPRLMKRIEDTRRGYGEGIAKADSWRKRFDMVLSRDRQIAADRDYAENQLNDWFVDDKSREIFIGNWAEGSVFGDLWQERDLTNRKGAELLRALIAQHFNGEETFWQTTARLAIGTGLVVFGAAEIVAGVSLAGGGTALSAGTASPLTITGGVALTAVGADQVIQGRNMLVSPDPKSHYGPIGALVHHLGKNAGGKSGGQVADFSWTAIQILVSLGGSFSAAKLAREVGEGAIPDGTAFRTLSNAPSRMEYHAFKVENYPLNYLGQTADVTPSLAGRGLFVKLDEGAEFLIESGALAHGETLRVFLRARTLDNMAALAKSAGRRLQALGAKAMTPAQRNAIERGAAKYGTKVERLSARQFDERTRAAGGNPDMIAAAFDNSSGTLILRQDATYYEAFHELQHARQWSELGPEAYGKLSTFERENYVFQRIAENSHEFNKMQLGHAAEYVVREARKPYGIPDFVLPKRYPKNAVRSYRDFVNNPMSYDEILMLDRYLPGAELDQGKLIKMAEEILKSEDRLEAVVTSDFAGVHVQERESPIFGEKTYYFVASDPAIKIGYNHLHFDFTLDGRYAGVGMFGEPLRNGASKIKKLGNINF